MKRKPIVVKFGGSNMKTSRDIRLIVDVIKRYETPLIVVVSALYGLTDRLAGTVRSVKDDAGLIVRLRQFLLEAKRDIVEQFISDPAKIKAVMDKLSVRAGELERYLKAIHLLGQTPEFAEDLILSYGERLSSSLLESLLKAEGLDCEEVLPEDMGLVTDGEFKNASIDCAASRAAVRRRLGRNTIHVVPGFYGISPDGKVNLLGRGGSDYSAAAIARCVEAKSLDVWKDVDGFMSADPGSVPDARPVRRMSYREASELAYFGAKILHPRTMEPLAGTGIPIRVHNINDAGAGAVSLIEEAVPAGKGGVKSVASTDRIGVLHLDGPGLGTKPGVLAKAASALDAAGINIKSVITAQTAITILLSDTDLAPALKTLERLELATVASVKGGRDAALVAAVGEGMRRRHGILARITGVLADEGINIKIMASGPSEVAAYLVVRRSERRRAENAIHRALFRRRAKTAD
ncbi:MAG: aspartate kinase [Elusimicrobiales bacterium]|nr:aspartate kinase [Elusimicrobiales bacterium]